ncbi:XRE family transcriptional regulator, partial [Acidithiobacillus sp.]|uniref:XRE family transcriptional regulator n=1 Tax=Acidithiobacillus sp. TaxID=1872118 RepID=UPI003D08F0B6
MQRLDIDIYSDDQMHLKLRLELVEVLRRIISERGWTQSKAAQELDISRPQLCKLLGGMH